MSNWHTKPSDYGTFTADFSCEQITLLLKRGGGNRGEGQGSWDNEAHWFAGDRTGCLQRAESGWGRAEAQWLQSALQMAKTEAAVAAASAQSRQEVQEGPAKATTQPLCAHFPDSFIIERWRTNAFGVFRLAHSKLAACPIILSPCELIGESSTGVWLWQFATYKS